MVIVEFCKYGNLANFLRGKRDFIATKVGFWTRYSSAFLNTSWIFSNDKERVKSKKAEVRKLLIRGYRVCIYACNRDLNSITSKVTSNAEVSLKQAIQHSLGFDWNYIFGLCHPQFTLWDPEQLASLKSMVLFKFNSYELELSEITWSSGRRSFLYPNCSKGKRNNGLKTEVSPLNGRCSISKHRNMVIWHTLRYHMPPDILA